MDRTLIIVGLGGSIAAVSRSRAALQVALQGAASAGAETRLLDVRELGLPMFNPEDDEPTEAATELIETCHSADGMVWSSPLYQGTISGAFKKRARLAAPPGRSEAAVPARQGDRAHQRRRRNAGTSSHQHDGVRHPSASRLGGSLRRSGRGCGAGLRSRGAHPRSGGRAAVDDARWRGRTCRATVRGRRFASSCERMPPGSRTRRRRRVTALLPTLRDLEKRLREVH